MTFRKELSNHTLAKASRLAFYKRLKKLNLLDAFHDKMMDGMKCNHRMFLTEEKAAELKNELQYFCTLNFVQKNSTIEKKVRPKVILVLHTSVKVSTFLQLMDLRF